MKRMSFSEAIDDALGQAMAKDARILLLGEDVQGLHGGLFVRFGRERVRNTPISEAAFLGAAVTASMAGLRPVAEIMLVDFIAVAVDALAQSCRQSGGVLRRTLERAAGGPHHLWRRVWRWRPARAKPVGLAGAHSGTECGGTIHSGGCGRVDAGIPGVGFSRCVHGTQTDLVRLAGLPRLRRARHGDV